MYRESDLQACIFGLVGFRQNQNPNYPVLTPSLLVSSSGLYFQDEHPLLTVENLDQALTNYDAYPYDAFDVDAEYETGDKVRAVNLKVYESLVDANTGNEPSASPADWAEVNLFSQKLEAVVRSAINKLAAQTFQLKKLRQSTKTLIENTQLFSGNGSLIDKEIKVSRFVGFIVTLADHRDLITILRRVGTQFTQLQTGFKLFIFHTSQSDPIDILTFDITKQNSFEWHLINFSFKYLSDDYAPGGSFRIGYYEDLLTGQAINRGYDFQSAPLPCNCNDWFSLYQKWSQFITIQPFEVTPDIVPDEEGAGAAMWDPTREVISWSKSYGLNFDLSVRCDCTDFLCREKTLFTQVLMKQVAFDLMSEIAYSVRNNVIAKETRDLAMYALETRPNSNPGMRKQLDTAIEEMDFDTSDLNEACLPCKDSGYGPTYSNI
jgi:hypothetical protein